MLILRELLRDNLIKIYTRTHQTAPNFQNFLRELAYAPEHPSICVQLNYNKYVFLLENNHFLFKVISKYTVKCISRETLLNISSKELPHS